MEITDSYANEPELGNTELGAEVIDQSRRTRRVHDLPAEILANIFLATECYNPYNYRHKPTHQAGVSPTTLASVCRGWRYVSLGLPWLWSHINLVTKWVWVTHVHSDYVRLMSQRSLDVTIALSIWVHNDLMSSRKTTARRVATISERTLAQLVSVLVPLAHRICRLQISSDIYSGAELQPILTCMIKLCSTGLLETFTVHAADSPLNSTRIFGWTNSHLASPTDHQLGKFLQPVRVLDLQEAFIPWDTGLYQGLTELSIGFTSVTRDVNCRRLEQIISACPALKLLSLRNVYAACSLSASTWHEPVYLKQLQRLELVCAHPQRLVHMLQVLRLKSQRLNVVISTTNRPEFVEQLHTFLNETSVVASLHIRPKVKTAWFAPLHKSLHRLLKLSLWGCDFADPDLAIFVRTEHYNHGTVPWPWLYELRLFRCIVELEFLECFANSPFLRRLRLFDCKVRSSDPGKLKPVTMFMFEPVFGDPHVEVLIYDDILAYQ